MEEKFIDLKNKIFKNEDVTEDVELLLEEILDKPTLEEIVLLQGLVDMTEDEKLIKKVSRITNLVKFPLKKVVDRK